MYGTFTIIYTINLGQMSVHISYFIWEFYLVAPKESMFEVDAECRPFHTIFCLGALVRFLESS